MFGSVWVDQTNKSNILEAVEYKSGTNLLRYFFYLPEGPMFKEEEIPLHISLSNFSYYYYFFNDVKQFVKMKYKIVTYVLILYLK